MPLTPEEIEVQLEELREGQARLRRLLRSGKAFTHNPLALTTDLDDLGSVKTFLDFEELPVNPDAPAPSVGRLYARGAPNDAILRWINESSEAQSFVMWKDATNHSFIRGDQDDTIAIGTRSKAGTVTHNAGWASAGVVLCTVQNANAFGVGERPCTITVYSIGVNSFGYILDTHVNVAAARGVTFAYIADGVI